MSGHCHRCGENGSPIEVARDGEVVAFGALCDPCFALALAKADELRLEFESLLEAGISVETANAVMIAKIEGRSGDA